MDYLFCASKNDFSMARFYESFSYLTNLLVVCQTNKDKVIGGFTTIPLNDGKVDNEYV
jgi:hypothetical protein